VRLAVIAWAVGVALITAWTFTPRTPPPLMAQIQEINRGKAFGDNEEIYVESRHQLRKSAVKTYFGRLGADYIAKQWASTDDQRIDRLTQDAYTKGYLKPADFGGPAGRLIALVVRDERVTGKACAS
jgi:hypothetical protein